MTPNSLGILAGAMFALLLPTAALAFDSGSSSSSDGDVGEQLHAARTAIAHYDYDKAEGYLQKAIAGNQDFTFVGVVDFSTRFFTGAGQIGYFTTATDTFILLNTRVDAGPVDFEEATIRIAGVHAVDAGWFVL